MNYKYELSYAHWYETRGLINWVCLEYAGAVWPWIDIMSKHRYTYRYRQIKAEYNFDDYHTHFYHMKVKDAISFI